MTKTFSKFSLAIICLAILVRLFGMIEYPLHDPTEARYAEIPRLMIETGNWVMPPFDYGVPFWAKPPLTFWLTGISFHLFGYSKFAARLPVFLLAGLVLWLSFRFAKVLQSTEKAAFSSIVLISTALFFIASGAVMTDMALCLCISLSMISFWQALNNPIMQQVKKWGYLFFVGLGFGLLVKGPIVGVLVLLPLIAWIIIEKQGLAAWQKIPWFKGSALMLLIAVPWYIMAEIESPGFINYFLVGEHYKRFVDLGWHGDLYGVAHKHPYGKIWLLWLFASFPWSFIFLGCILSWPLRKNKSITLKNACQSSWHRYLMLWAIAPMVFFTFAGNILYTYVLPGLPAFAIMVTEMLCLRFDINAIMQSRWLYAGLIIPVVGLFFMGLVWVTPEKLKFEKNQKYLVNIYQQSKHSDQSQLSYSANKRLFSIDFHTQGQANHILINRHSTTKLSNNQVEDYLIMKKSKLSIHKDGLLKNFAVIAEYRKYVLIKEK